MRRTICGHRSLHLIDGKSSPKLSVFFFFCSLYIVLPLQFSATSHRSPSAPSELQHVSMVLKRAKQKGISFGCRSIFWEEKQSDG